MLVDPKHAYPAMNIILDHVEEAYDMFEHVLCGKPFMYADDLKKVYHFKRFKLVIYEILINFDVDMISQFS